MEGFVSTKMMDHDNKCFVILRVASSWIMDGKKPQNLHPEHSEDVALHSSEGFG
jgi:hypothetical protein